MRPALELRFGAQPANATIESGKPRLEPAGEIRDSPEVVELLGGALNQGSMINFVIVDRRVRFEVALDSVERSGLKLSSRLLAVAQQVRTGAN